MSAGKSIQLIGIAKEWGKTQALGDVSIDIPAGSFTALLGPSGCGKSTLLRILSGLESPSKGQVLLDSQDVTPLPADKRNLSMVFQSYALFPHMSVADNITFGLRTRGVPRAERQKKLNEVAELLALTPYLHRRPAALSGGQQQRVALGRAVIAERAICLMDEPLSNLDAKLRQTMRSELRSLQKQLGFTMVYVTHDQVEAITMADQVVLMNAGRIEQVATPHTLYMRPATAFAARFIGTPPMNLIPLADLGPAFAELAQTHGPQTLLGIRPEALRPAAHSPLKMSVISTEYLGADALIHGTIGQTPVTLRHAGASPQPADQLPLALSATDIHLFDAQTGGRFEPADLASLLTRTGIPGVETGALAPSFQPKDH